MIQANELRIGNYALHNDGLKMVQERVVIESIQKDYCTTDTSGCQLLRYEWLEGLPLTESLILSLGTMEGGEWRQEFTAFDFSRNGVFERRIKCDLHKETGLQLILNLKEAWAILFDIGFDKIWIPQEVTHLHQLQNLYWCLCGRELVFNPNR